MGRLIWERACRAWRRRVLGAPDPVSQSGADLHPVSLPQGNVVALVHDSGDAEDEENDILLNGLSHQSHLILRAEGLASGFCRDVHGQVRSGGARILLGDRPLLSVPLTCGCPGVVSGQGWSAWGVPSAGRESSEVVGT